MKRSNTERKFLSAVVRAGEASGKRLGQMAGADRSGKLGGSCRPKAGEVRA